MTIAPASDLAPLFAAMMTEAAAQYLAARS